MTGNTHQDRHRFSFFFNSSTFTSMTNSKQHFSTCQWQSRSLAHWETATDCTLETDNQTGGGGNQCQWKLWNHCDTVFKTARILLALHDQMEAARDNQLNAERYQILYRGLYCTLQHLTLCSLSSKMQVLFMHLPPGVFQLLFICLLTHTRVICVVSVVTCCVSTV